MKNRVLAFLAIIGMVFCSVIPPTPANADAAVLKVTTVITGTSTNVQLPYLQGQSSCNTEIVGTASGTIQGLVQNTWVPINGAKSDESGTTSTINGPGTWFSNCASMQGFRFVPSSVTGSATITLTASGAVGRVIGAGVNGGRTQVVGTSPITVTNSGNTATVGLTTPITIAQGGTGATALPAGCLTSNGTIVTTQACTTPGPAATPVSVIPGSSNVTVATPSPGVFAVSVATPAAGFALAHVTTAYGFVPASAQASNITLRVDTTANFFNGQVVQVEDPSTGNSFSGTVNSINTPGLQISIFYVAWTGSGSSIPPASSVTIPIGANIFSGGGGTSAGTNLVQGDTTGLSYSPNLSLSNAPVITGNMTANNFKATALAGATGCLTADSTGLFTPAPCGVGTVTGLTAGNDIVVGTGATPSVAVTNAPGFTGTVTAAGFTYGSGYTSYRCISTGFTGGLNSSLPCGAITQINSSFTIPAVGGTVSISYTPGISYADKYQPFSISDGTSSVSGYFNATGVGTGTSSVTITSINQGTVGGTMASGAFVTAGGYSMATSAPATVVSPGPNEVITGTAQNPIVGPTQAPVFTGPLSASALTATGLTTGRCVQTTTGGLLSVASGACATGTSTSTAQFANTNATFVIPAIGNTVTVNFTPTSTSGWSVGDPVTISDYASNTVSGMVNSTISVGSTSFTFLVQQIVRGAAGNTMGSGADIMSGIAFTNTPVYTGNITGQQLTATGNTNIPSVSWVNGSTASESWVLNTQTGTGIQINGISPTAVGLDCSAGTACGANHFLFNVDTSGNLSALGGVYGSTFNGSGSGLTAGTVPNAALVTAPVTSVSGSGNTQSTGGTTPVVTVTDAPTFPNITVSAISKNHCVKASTAGLFAQTSQGCGILGQLGATFVIPALGSTVSVTVADQIPTLRAFTPMSISDGTNTVSGYNTALVSNSSTITFQVTQINAGAVGNTMAITATAATGINPISNSVIGNGNCIQGTANGLVTNSGSSCPSYYKNGSLVGPSGGFGLHLETFSGTAIANGANNVYTFGTAYTFGVPCFTAQSAAGTAATNQGLFNSTTLTTVTVTNNTGVSQTPTVFCIGE